jgi:hypothetical protein
VREKAVGEHGDSVGALLASGTIAAVAGSVMVDRIDSLLRDKIEAKCDGFAAGGAEREFRNAFRYFDLPGTGTVDMVGFGRALERFGLLLSQPQLEAAFAKHSSADSQHRAVIYADFCRTVLRSSEAETSQPDGLRNTMY